MILSRLVEKGVTSMGQRYDVSIESGRKVLNSVHTNYSFGSLHKVMLKGINEVYRKMTPDDVLMLGLGAGSALEILEMKGSGRCRVTAVEIDQGIIDVAERHFGLGSRQHLQVICKSAEQAVFDLLPASYDLVVDDVFLDNEMPDFSYGERYLEQIGRLLRQKGVYMRNVMGDNKRTDSFESALRNIFQEIKVLVEPDFGNRIYLCQTIRNQ